MSYQRERRRSVVTKPPRNLTDAVAQVMDVSPGYARRYLRNDPTPAMDATDALLGAMAKAADLEAARSLDDIDIDDAVESGDPSATLKEIVGRRSDRVLRAQLAAHESWARTEDRTARTAPARDAFMARFERQVDPDGVLSPQERTIRAEHAKKAHFLRLALKSAQARRR